MGNRFHGDLKLATHFSMLNAMKRDYLALSAKERKLRDDSVLWDEIARLEGEQKEQHKAAFCAGLSIGGRNPGIEDDPERVFDTWKASRNS